MEASGEQHVEVDRGPELTGWRRPAVWMLSVLVRCWVRTLRVSCPEEERALGRNRETPVVMLTWHNRGFFIPWCVRNLCQVRPTYAMVSLSRDGAIMGRFFSILGLRLVRGSSSRQGREALHAMIGCLRAGHDVAFTPDGPRGPLYEVKGGAVLCARRGRAPFLVVGVEFKNAWRLKSWDRYYIPKPFSRVNVRMELVPSETLPHGNASLVFLRERLLTLSNAWSDAPATPTTTADDAGEETQDTQ